MSLFYAMVFSIYSRFMQWLLNKRSCRYRSCKAWSHPRRICAWLPKDAHNFSEVLGGGIKIIWHAHIRLALLKCFFVLRKPRCYWFGISWLFTMINIGSMLHIENVILVYNQMSLIVSTVVSMFHVGNWWFHWYSTIRNKYGYL